MDFYIFGFNVPYIILMIVGTLVLLRLRKLALRKDK